MKEWVIDYSIRMIDGEVEEVRETLEARTITEVLTLADFKHRKKKLSNPEVSDIVICGVYIAGEDVF